MTSTAPPVLSESETDTTTHGLPETTGSAFGLKGLAWAVFEMARNPYYNMVVIYIFAPYFAYVMIGGGAEGLATTSDIVTIAGIITALTAPFLGFAADRAGRKKPLIAIFIGVLATCSFLLWWAKPDGSGLAVPAVMAILAAAYCCYGYSEVLHNAMLPDAGRPSSLPVISGLGLAMGNVASVGILLFFLFALLLPNNEAMAGFPMVASETLFGLDAAQFEPQRLAGPFAAIWMAIFMTPFFLVMPDRPRPGASWSRALADLLFGEDRKTAGASAIAARLANLVGYLRNLTQEHPQTMKYLAARTIYADGMAALLTLGAVFATTYWEWSSEEILVFGLAGLLFGALGGFVGGMLDQRLGPKNALIVEISALTVMLFIQLSITPDSLFFGLIDGTGVVWGSPLFPTLSDVVYFSFIIPVAITVVASISSSRYMLVHLAPRERIGEFFGLYAIAGTITVWMGPLVVGLLTRLTDNQRIGMGGIGVMFLIGLLILLTVRASREPTTALR